MFQKVMIWLFFCGLSGVLMAQTIEISVLEYKTKKPISGAQLMFGDIELAKTDAQGKASLPASKNKITIVADKYESTVVSTGFEAQTVYLIPLQIQKSIGGVVIKPEDDPYSLSLIAAMIREYPRYNPSALPSYKQMIYSKFLLDANKKDTAFKNYVQKKKSDTEMIRFFDTSCMFLWERMIERKYDQKLGQKNNILYSRMSGVKNPLYDMMAMNYSLDKLPAMFEEKNYRNYYYTLEDSLMRDGRKTYKLYFVPKRKQKTDYSRHGTVYIDAATSAIVQFAGNNKNSYLEFDTKRQDNVFYMNKMYYSTVPPFITADIPLELKITSATSQFTTPETYQKKEFSGSETEVSEEFNSQKSLDLMNQLRPDPLTKSEQNTYTVLDSMSKEWGIEKRLNLLTSLQKGTLKLGAIDWKFRDLLNYNDYEGFRVQLGFKTNQSFHKKLSLNGYVAYGFKDRGVKGGLGWDYMIHYHKNAHLGMNFSTDVTAAGSRGSEMNFQYPSLFFKYYTRDWNAFLFYKTDLNRYMDLKVQAGYLQQGSKFDYTFNSNPQNYEYQYILPQATLNWYPKSEYLTTPAGKVLTKDGETRLQLHYQYYMPVNKISSDFHKIDFQLNTSVPSFFRRLDLMAKGGLVLNDAPLYNNFNGLGISPYVNTLLNSFGFAERGFFATMPQTAMFNDKFVSLFAYQPLYYHKINKLISISPELQYGVLWGDFANPQEHSFAFTSSKKVYQEVGLMMKNLLMNFGVGAYYRFGGYNDGMFKNNFAVRMSISLGR